MNRIIQWNIRGAMVNYFELLLFITKYCLVINHMLSRKSPQKQNHHQH